MKSKPLNIARSVVSFIILLIMLSINTVFLRTSVDASGVTTTDPPEDPKVEIINPYLSAEYHTLPEGTEVTAYHVNGPSKPPKEFEAQRAASTTSLTGSDVWLSNFPSYNWVFGCGAVSGAMIAAYYDRNGYSNVYTGPTNGGVMPATDTSWGTWSDGHETYSSNPLIASQIGVDGRTQRGSIEDYWIEMDSSADDPYITNGWTQHSWGTAIGDYMKTSQSAYNNPDGQSVMWTYNAPSSDKYHCNDMSTNAQNTDLTYGMREFYEARGYSVNTCYNQKTDNQVTGGFSLGDFQTEIDAGHPVLIFLKGHFIVGYGYDNYSSDIYVRDTWDSDPSTTYKMTWGGSYSNMELLAVGIIHLNPPPVTNHLLTVNKTGNGTGLVTSSPAGINCGGTCSAYYQVGTNVALTATANQGSTFLGWGGACSGTSTTCVVSMTQALNVTATFSATIATTFADVPQNYWAYSWINRLFNAGITSGCATNPLRYCPENQVTRAEMAKFLLKGIYGQTYEPPALQPGESTGFSDVPWNHWAARWIKKLALDGITSGCGPGIYCPEQKVNRAEMAKFLLKAKYGAYYEPNTTGTQNLIQDPSFEAYTPNPYWTEFSYNFGTPLCTIDDCGDGAGTAGPRSGDVWAWFGGTLYSNEEGYIVQNVIIPVGADTLEFYFWIGAATTSSSPNDIFSVYIGSQEIFSANGTQTDDYPGYTRITLDISAFADGQVHPLKFYSIISRQLTNFNLDDVAIYGSGITSPTFIDVPLNHWASQWIEKLYQEGITSGCGGGKFCPNNSVTRAEMAKFLSITFNLPE